MISCFFSPGLDILDAIREHLELCTTSLDICVYTISDDRLVEAIIQCHRAGITVRILSDNDKQYDKGSDIQSLSLAGVDVRVDTSPAHMHHKFMVVDSDIVLTGSYNWTRSAAMRNSENLVSIQDSKVANQFQQEFEHLWAAAAPLQS